MSRAAIIAAMPGELRPFVRGRPRERRGRVSLWRGGKWIAACAGAGAAAAAHAFAEIEKDGAVDGVLSAGWAGALRPEFAAGRVYRVSGIIDEPTGERFAAGGPGGCRLVTVREVAGAAEKRRLAASFDADLVDMEAAAVARLAQARGIPFLCFKGVSDGPGDRLPDFNDFFSKDGEFHGIRFGLHALARPWLWPVLTRLRDNSRKAALELNRSLNEVLDDPAAFQKGDGGTRHQR